MDADIKVTAEGDVKPLIDALNAAGGATDKFASKASKKLAEAAAKIKSSTGTAALALNNLGRVAQDLPFGFIAIQNNLNPLLEGFQRLRAETGSNKLAFKALISSLSGAGGIGLALSLAGTAVSFITNGFEAWTRGFGDNEKAAKKHKDVIELSVSTYDKFLAKVEEISQAMAQESAKVQLIGNALLASNTGLKERKELIGQLIQVSPAYFQGLDAEKSSYQQIAKALQDYSEGLAQITQVKALLPQFEGMIQKVIKLRVELNELKQFQGGAFGLPEEEFKSQSKILTDQIRGITNEIEVAKKALSNIAGGPLKLQEILFGKPDKTTKDIQTISDVLREMEHQLQVINKEELFKGLDLTKDKLTTLQTAVKTLFDKFNLSGDNKIIVGLGVRIDELELQQRLKGTVANIQSNNLTPAIPLALTVKPLDRAALDASIKVPIILAISDTAKKVNEIVSNMAAEMAAGIGEALGNALTGKGNFKDLFSSIFTTLGTALQQLGKVAIEVGIGIKAIKKAFETLNPIVSIAAGIGLIALGAIIKNSVANVGRFATGGFVSGPGSSTSDSIPARLSAGEYVINAATVSKFGKGFFDNINGGARPTNGRFATGGPVGSIGGGQFITVEVVGNIRGNDIYIANRRTALKIGRNG